MDDWLGLFDEPARTRLHREIDLVRSAGGSIQVGVAHDEAYAEPDEIREVFTQLRELDRRLATVTQTATRWFDAPNRRKDDQRTNAQLKERHRIDWLFGPEETDSVAWHEQRGRAAALLTITAAHDLTDETGVRRYQTMSGPLSKSVLDHRFDVSVPIVGGLALGEAVERVEATIGGRAPGAARKTAEKRIEQLSTFLEAPVNARFRRIIRYCTDSLGIRSRKNLVAHQIAQVLDRMDDRHPLMMSFGCGTALPILEVLAARRDHGHHVPRLILLDQDPLALAAAAELASQMQLTDHIEIHCQRLFDRWGRPLDLRKVLKDRRLAVAEDSGLREYLPDRIYRWLTAETWRSLAPGGLMSTGNMNSSRPQQEFLHGMMGWKPVVHMRPIQHGLALHKKAGVPPSCTSTVVSPDGVYSLFFSIKA